MDKKMQLVLDIMQLAVEISKNTEADVFASYLGHVDQLEIMVFHGGWAGGRSAGYEKRIYLDAIGNCSEEDITKTLEEVYAELVNL